LNTAHVIAGTRALVKRVGERVVISTGIAAIVRRTMPGRTLILAYHNVMPDGDGDDVRGDISLHLPRRQFARHLDALGRLGDVVPLSSIDDEPRSGRPRFVVTFDDAYAGALSAGVDELRRRGMPATVFVAPGLLGQTTWWDALADPTSGLTPDDTRHHALTQLAGRADVILAWARSTLGRQADPRGAPQIGTLEQLRSALAYDGLTVASHTWSHLNLAALGAAELERELRSAAEWLTAQFPERYAPWLSYPYGLSTPAVERAAMAIGYTAAVRVNGGWIGTHSAPNRFAVPRYNVPRGLSDAGLSLRLSGIGA
jgi:peptidoglycan/xylan/chitin deacetylase (PgdA/CDA1 family)